MFKDPVLDGSRGMTLSQIRTRIVEIKDEARPVLGGMSFNQVYSVFCSVCVFVIKRQFFYCITFRTQKKKKHMADLDRRLPTLISDTDEDEEGDLVFDPARDELVRMTYFYKNSQPPGANEVCKSVWC